MKARVLLTLTGGAVPLDIWAVALRQEAPVEGQPKACTRCPLRSGGEWEVGARAALSDADETELGEFSEGWGCHAEPRPCAGMARLCRSFIP